MTYSRYNFCLTYLLFQEVAGIIKLSAHASFSLFECRKVVTGSKSPDLGNGTISFPHYKFF